MSAITSEEQALLNQLIYPGGYAALKIRYAGGDVSRFVQSAVSFANTNLAVTSAFFK